MQSQAALVYCKALFAASLIISGSGQAQTSDEWLARMVSAVEVTNYRGKLVRNHRGKVVSLSVVHKYEDGQVSEKIETMDGADRTIIRNADGVRCILPESKSVLVEHTSTAHGWFSRVPVDIERLSTNYDVIKVRDRERVANLDAVLIAIRPRDEYRYGHRLWLERETALPLKSELLDSNGRVIEEIRFVDLTLEDSIAASEFEPGIDLAGFRYISSADRKPALVLPEPDVQQTSVEDGEQWTISRLPVGYQFSLHAQTDKQTHHLKSDDGMATVSVFIEPPKKEGSRGAAASAVGSSNAYSIWSQNRQITAVGEVPMRTVKLIAESVVLGTAN